MWRILNSPIVIAILIVIALFSYDQLKKNKAANEIRAVYEELISISEDAKDDLERKKLVEISSPNIIENKQFSKNQKLVIYQVKNDSQEYLGKIAHTIELYNKNELVDVKDEWGQVKLAPGESMSYSFKASNNELVYDNVKITVWPFLRRTVYQIHALNGRAFSILTGRAGGLILI